MRIIFVGIHNKPNKKPLDSTTATGKIIDEVIKNINFKSIKTNLFNIDYLPADAKLRERLVREWHSTVNPTKGDMVIMLGGWVYDNYLAIYSHNEFTIIKTNHPAYALRRGFKDLYIDTLINLINEVII